MDNIVELMNQDGKMEKYIHIETVDFSGNKYVMLEPYSSGDNEPEESEYIILRIDKIDGRDALVMIEDKNEFEKVAEIFREILEDELEIE